MWISSHSPAFALRSVLVPSLEHLSVRYHTGQRHSTVLYGAQPGPSASPAASHIAPTVLSVTQRYIILDVVAPVPEMC